ncbi:type II toxin-antitoxin system Phd/YefM family antitoxin [Lapillicoccus jejuensis]|uniref:Antitoxin n=1 Tax=Lapillicoccus jejuensis TaxID=402171 RepID=A0A542DWZ5_9MICO|nr:type II toxin-antitoxin system Phd/YefM family antitoxin [Lapillicoccus jejuensis]TQJ07612.1 prevent-host-death family protein [Lapillicoccus jejuensis]
MKTISVGELRQNPTAMLADVAAGETYAVTRHHREVARVVPASSSPWVVPPKAPGPARTADLPPVPLPEGLTIDLLVDELKGEW